MSNTAGSGLGEDGTIPDSDDGLAVGHVPDGSNFNHEEDPNGTPESPTAELDDEPTDDRPASH